jgi:gamma-glutamylcyclotransferase (GGCT)/AIG2-like uncharacterized protein YtfP
MIDSEQRKPAPNTTRLFVYGTLRPAQPNFVNIKNLVIAHESATTEGELLDLGAFPALVPGDGIVVGDLLTIHSEALRITDRIESCELGAGRNLYDRREVAVTHADGSTISAWTYIFARPERLVGRPKAVVGERDGRPVFAWPMISAGDSLPKSKRTESKA